MTIEVDRVVLAGMLREHDEHGLADRALSASDDELARIGTLGGYCAFSEDAMVLGGSMGGTRALALAAIDVLEGTGPARDATTRRERLHGACQGSPTQTRAFGTESFNVMLSNGSYPLTRASESLTFSILRRGIPHPPTPLL
jgi:hypothetical protein